MQEQEYIEFESVTLIRQTEKAGLFKHEEWEQDQWIPWSQIGDDSVDRDGETGSLYLTKWICDQKELEY